MSHDPNDICPAWSRSPEAERLIAAVLAERPDCWWLTRYSGVRTVYPRYRGPAARNLRNYWEALREAAPDAAAFRELSECWPDDLIHRLMEQDQAPMRSAA